MLKALVPGLSLLLLISTAQAQQANRPDPGCGRDVSRFCRPLMGQPDGVILGCLQQNRARLSKVCAKVLADHGQ
jgi:hypothetical protein